MAVASVQNSNRKRTTIILTAGILLTGLLVAFLLITLNRLRTPQTVEQRAAEIVQPTSAVPPPQACQEEGTCSWKTTEENARFTYEVHDVTSGEPGAIVKSGETTATSVSFPVFANHKYTCIVSVINECGESPKATATNTCQIDVTPTPTPVDEISPTPTPSPTATPTPNPSVTPSPTSQITPTPTEIIIVVSSVTPTPNPSATPTVTSAPPPPPPQAGVLWPSIALIAVGIFIVMVGFVLP